MSESKKQDLIFRALANEMRRSILDRLSESPCTTGDLCARFPTRDRCTVMQHLRLLERVELVIVRRDGRTRWNYLNVAPIREIYDRWISRYAAHPVDLLTRLKRDLES